MKDYIMSTRHIFLCFILIKCGTFVFAISTFEIKQGLIPSEFKYSMACGPIACYAAIRLLGHDTTLEEVARKCHWESGLPTSLQQIQDCIKQSGLNCIGRKMSIEELSHYLQDGKHVAILPIRKFSNDIDHVLLGVKVGNGKVITFDYPELLQEINCAKFMNNWDGHALIVSNQESSSWKYALYSTAVISGLYFILTTQWRKNKSV